LDTVARLSRLSTLRQLIFAHSHAIAYESLDIMLGRTPKLDVGALQRKMIFGGRGGYCLEQNMLFRAGLRSLGYQITSLQGRVVRGMAIDAPRPAIHMLLQVELAEGPYLADVGFGNLAPTSALLLRPGHTRQCDLSMSVASCRCKPNYVITGSTSTV